MSAESSNIAWVLIVIVSVAGVLSCLRVLATRLERDRALQKLVAKSRVLKKQQDRRMDALRSGEITNYDEVLEVGEPSDVDVEIVDDDELEQAA